MRFFKNALLFAKKVHWKVWLLALVVPGGFIGVGSWVVVRSVHRIFKKRGKAKIDR